MTILPENTALIIVDVEGDFIEPAGSLAVPGSLGVIDPIVALAQSGRFRLVIKTRDAHPAGHMSFGTEPGKWRVHCVDGTPGAELHPAIAALTGPVIDKATLIDVDAYSAFAGTDLAALLFEHGITHVVVVGLATDYCVKATALDARKAGFETFVVREAVAAVNVTPGDDQRALADIAAPIDGAAAGHVIALADVLETATA